MFQLTLSDSQQLLSTLHFALPYSHLLWVGILSLSIICAIVLRFSLPPCFFWGEK